MLMRICWGLCALTGAAAAILGGGRGIVPFIAVDSLSAVVAAVTVAALWNRSGRRENVLSRAAYAALTGGALATIVNVSITLLKEPEAALIPMRLALGLTGLLYGAAAAGALLCGSHAPPRSWPVRASI